MNSFKKILKLPTLKKKLAPDRKAGRMVAFTNGCFDILHYGHISYLEKAKKNDRILIVGLNSDKSVRKIKGKNRPIVPEDQRAFVLSGLACIDYIILFDEETPATLIEKINPDVLIKGADWKGKKIAGEDFVRTQGGKVEYIHYVPKCSSTNIIEKILKSARKKR